MIKIIIIIIEFYKNEDKNINYGPDWFSFMCIVLRQSSQTVSKTETETEGTHENETEEQDVEG